MNVPVPRQAITKSDLFAASTTGPGEYVLKYKCIDTSQIELNINSLPVIFLRLILARVNWAESSTRTKSRNYKERNVQSKKRKAIRR